MHHATARVIQFIEYVLEMLKMDDDQRLKMLEYPHGKIDVVIDSDTYNEIDDAFAIAYALLSRDRLNVLGIYAAPFAMNEKSDNPAYGMEASYQEILKILGLMKIPYDGMAFRGSTFYGAPQKSDAVKHLINFSRQYDNKKPLYIIAIGAITNIASAVLLDPSIIDRVVLVWLGGNALYDSPNAYNVFQDIKSSKIIFDCGIPLVHVPCWPVTSHLLVSVPELEKVIGGKNHLCDYLVESVKKFQEEHIDASGWGDCWNKEIWDVGAVGYLIDKSFSKTEVVTSPILTDNITWSFDTGRHVIKNVKELNRNQIFYDMFSKLSNTY